MTKFSMDFDPNTIEHLGLKLYSTLPPVISELVANSWDADAKTVNITIPAGEITPFSEVTIVDDGNGMNEQQIEKAYLKIGRNCRVDLKKDETPGHRKFMGRKGIGKLAPFGIATEMDVKTVQDGKEFCIRLNYDEIKLKGTPYNPQILNEKVAPKENNGTTITIRKFKRTKPIDIDQLRKNIARRFSVIGSKFTVYINTIPIEPKDRRLAEQCVKYWDVKDMPGGDIVDTVNGWKVQGWIGFVEKSSQIERGVDIFVRGKTAEIDSMFSLSTTNTQFSRAYIVGEVHADFLDSDADEISTGRNSIMWDSIEGEKLEIWGKNSLKFVMSEWLKYRQDKKKADIKTPDFEKWLQTRQPREQKAAEKMVSVIIQNDDIEPEAAKPLLEIVKSNIEFQAFQDLVDEIDKSSINISKLLSLIGEWRIFEAREVLRLSDGRLDIIEKLAEYMKSNALEVKEVQPLFEENGWLVNPVWVNVTGQNTYTELLRKNCVEPTELLDSNRRMDILGYDDGGTLHIVELKRPHHKLTAKDLTQVESYVLWARANILNGGPDSPKYVDGLLIVGEIESKKEIELKRTNLASEDIRVETFHDLLNKAEKTFGETEKRLKNIAPEYSRSSRRTRGKQNG